MKKDPALLARRMRDGPMFEKEGTLQTIDLDRGCFACALGGIDKRTLFLIAAEWRGMEQIPEVARVRTGQVLTVQRIWCRVAVGRA